MAISAEQFAALWPHDRRCAGRRTRFTVDVDGVEAVVDVYVGALAGLRTVEVEFASVEAADGFAPPAWFGREVTGVTGCGNRHLARHDPDGVGIARQFPALPKHCRPRCGADGDNGSRGGQLLPRPQLRGRAGLQPSLGPRLRRQCHARQRRRPRQYWNTLEKDGPIKAWRSLLRHEHAVARASLVADTARVSLERARCGVVSGGLSGTCGSCPRVCAAYRDKSGFGQCVGGAARISSRRHLTRNRLTTTVSWFWM
ncbi:hypothetical protein ACU686_11495 [Yinghuangia aomiensis]